jgi:UPF0271 protein
MRRILVLDSSAFIGGFQPTSGEECYTVQGVLEEVKKESLRLEVDLRLSEGVLRVLGPTRDSLSKVERAATESGDIALLSKTDMDLLSLALHFKGEGKDVAIVTDDYDIQNLAAKLGVSFLPAMEMGIRKVLRWKNICKGCGKRFPIRYKGRCDTCGSILKIIRG